MDRMVGRYVHGDEAMTPTLKQPPFDLPPATRDETAPRGGPIRAYEIKPSKRVSGRLLGRTWIGEIAAREVITFMHHIRGHDVDINVLPLDKLFR